VRFLGRRERVPKVAENNYGARISLPNRADEEAAGVVTPRRWK
jgi:hypothetical protein